MNNYTPQDEFLARWLSGELTQEELTEWKKHPDYQELSKIADISTRWKVPQNLTKEQAWQHLQKRAGFSSKKESLKTVFPMRRWLIAGIAAAIMLMAGIYFLTPEQLVIHKTLSAQSMDIRLPDGSEVKLNAGSEIAWQSANWNENREVRLDGEAFFQVAHGKTFTVKTTQGEISVLGTSFNVKDRISSFEVKCYTGKVQVLLPGQHSKEILRPNTGVRLSKEGGLAIFDFSATNKAADWVAGRFSFKNAEISTVVRELERQFDVKISLGEDTSQVFTGTFFNENLDEALKAVCEPLGLNYQTDSKTGQIKLVKK